MGQSALKSHMKGKLHQSVCGDYSRQTAAGSVITNFFTSRSTSSSVDPETGSSCTTENSQASGSVTAGRSVDTYVVADDILKAEVLWAIKVVMNHYSFNSCQNVSKLFTSMFPDSQIAKTFSCGATKCAYMICFGLQPYFHDLLVDKIRNTECYSISFDECTNNISQNEQMDFIVRYWDSDIDQVAVRYFGSEFLGHATAVDLLKHFKAGLTKLDPKCLLQVSMDGPNVNLKFYRDLENERKTEELPGMLNIGSCGLHIVHGSLQKGVTASGWNLASLLRALWQLFHDTPARREDFFQITGSSIFPLQFCPHRWVEDAKVAERALPMWPNVKKFVASFKDPKKTPSAACFSTIKAACADPLTTAKVEFFISIAKQLQPFLTRFQTDAPVIPFLGPNLRDLLVGLMNRFLKKELLEKADTYQKLAALDPQEKKNQVFPKNVDIGFAAKESLKTATNKKVISDLQNLAFKADCMSLLAATTAKLLERSPLKYSLLRYLESLCPQTIVNTSVDPAVKFEKLLHILMNGRWRSAEECDNLLSQYKTFAAEMKQENAAEFRQFTIDSKERLDTFFGKYLKNTKFAKLWDVFKLLLTLSHGQASVERGYSVNKDMLVENMQEKTLVALRTVYDSIAATGQDFTEVPFTPRMKRNIKAARMRYNQYLDDQRKAKGENEKAKKRKAVQDELHDRQKKKKLIESAIDIMKKEADDLAQKAERRHDFSLLTKSNAFRRKVTEKAQESKRLQIEMDELKEKLKNIE
ncbi:hypothetical protein HOLleu_11016 [Holothuria leucospilota]|uniref:Uncharacterized protein n=1 Tax=Holothuria leucospilota TaxID=206669 RepID=A0A9Q1CF38_HOLLE|nr:hypothetical protein HOLleu_11016 [Holothuria leucospilota]